MAFYRNFFGGGNLKEMHRFFSGQTVQNAGWPVDAVLLGNHAIQAMFGKFAK